MAETPAARQLEWVVEALRRAAGGVSPSAEEEAAHFAVDASTGNPAPIPRERFWAEHGARLTSSFRIAALEAPSVLEAKATLVRDDGKAWSLVCGVEPEEPFAIRFCAMIPTLPGLTTRLATDADAVALCELERRSPMVVGDVRVTVDRGSDYFASTRLMEKPIVGLAEIEGRAVAVLGANLVTVRIGGVVRRVVVPNHVRVMPEYQHTSMWTAISPVVFGPLATEMDGTISYIAARNEASRRAAVSQDRWSFGPVRAVLDTAAVAGPRIGRPAPPSELPQVVEILNECHEREEGFAPYTVESLSTRLARAPSQYSTGQLWLHRGAVVGVWSAGESITLIVETDAGRSSHRRAIALDFGFRDRCEADFEALLRAWCTMLMERDQDQLAIWTSPASPGRDVIEGLAGELEPFALYTTAPQPPDAALRGWYVDATSC
jgi:hypothetical protein